MAVLRIVRMGNPVLAQVAAPVTDPSALEIRRLAADIIETLEDIGASGLAAPALLQHECGHLDGIVYPMRMTDLGLLVYNEEPGQFAREVAADPNSIAPLFVDLVEHWPGRGRWLGNAAGAA